VLLTGISLAVNGSGSAFAAREDAFKQAFATLDSYAAGADKARNAFFDAGGVRVKTLIGEETITYRIALVNRLKISCAESTKLLETAEPTIDAWFESAGVPAIRREVFWKERRGHEYVEALKNLRSTEAKVTAAVGEYLGVMRRLNGHFAMADSDNVYFKDQEDLDTYNAALKKLDPPSRRTTTRRRGTTTARRRSSPARRAGTDPRLPLERHPTADRSTSRRQGRAHEERHRAGRWVPARFQHVGLAELGTGRGRVLRSARDGAARHCGAGDRLGRSRRRRAVRLRLDPWRRALCRHRPGDADRRRQERPQQGPPAPS
jgi:hypothetical protein